MENAEKRHSIFVITVLERMEQIKGWPSYGGTRAVGFYLKREDAVEAVHCNNCDMWETVYDYAVVEELLEGTYSECVWRQFYKYNEEKDEYEEIEEPDYMRHFAGISIG